MPITGSDPALMYARLNLMRLGASRLDYYQPTIFVYINGIARPNSIRIAGFSIRDELDGTPNTATLRVDGFVPTKGHEIKIYLGDATAAHALFAGHILEVTQVYDLLPAHLSYDLSCISYEWLLNRRKVTARYTSSSVTTIVLDLMTRFTSGFSMAGVVAGLASLDEITFTNEDVTDCLDRLAKRIGGRWIVDYTKVLHFGVTLVLGESDVHPITQTTPAGLISIAAATDLSQVKTRVLIEGGGSQAAAELAAGAPMLPVLDDVWYIATGGTVLAGPQRITYTGVQAGGTGALVGSIPTPTNAPTLTAALGAGLGTGLYGYAITFTDSTGETLPGPTVFVTLGGQLAAPATTPTVTPQTAAPGLANGTYHYAVTFTDAIGETLPGPHAIITIATYIVAPTAAALPVKLIGGTLSAGLYQWAYTFVNAAGQETDAGSSASVPMTMDNISAPASGPSGTKQLGGSLSLGGNYQYCVTYVTAAGLETIAGPTSAAIAIGGDPSGPTTIGTVTVQNAPGNLDSDALYRYVYVFQSGAYVTNNAPVAGPIGTVPGWQRAYMTRAGAQTPPAGFNRQFYRTEGGGSSYKQMTGASEGFTSDDSTYYYDNEADSSLGAALPASPTAVYRSIALTNIPLSPDGNVTKRRIYRTAAGGGAFGLVTELTNNTATTYTDTLADGSRGVNPPGTSTAVYRSAHLTIPVSPDSTTTKRRVYRTAANGASFQVVTELANNTATTVTDSLADAARGAALPTSNTTGKERAALSAIPIGPTGTLGRKVYRTAVNGSQLKLLTTLADNVTTTYTDSAADVALGANVPTGTTTATTNQVTLTTIPLGPSGTTGRKVYRTVVNGSALKLLTTIAGNVTTTHTDSAADVALGAAAPTANTSGLIAASGTLNAGSTVVPVTATGPFPAAGAWVQAASLQFRYTGKTDTTLTGVPASGNGALLSTLNYGTELVVLPALTGLPASGPGAIQFTIAKGDDVNVLVTRDDTAAQTAMAALVGGDGIHEDFIQDRRLSRVEAEDRGDARLLEVKNPEVRIQYATRDQTTRSGRDVTIALTAPAIAGVFRIQRVTITEFDPLLRIPPVRQVDASSRRYSFEALLRLIKGT